MLWRGLMLMLTHSIPESISDRLEAGETFAKVCQNWRVDSGNLGDGVAVGAWHVGEEFGVAWVVGGHAQLVEGFLFFGEFFRV